MTIIHYFNQFFKKIKRHELSFRLNKLKIMNLNSLILFSFLVFFSFLYLISSNLVSKRNINNQENLSTISKSNEFSQLTNFFIAKINSPYTETKYTIKKNDSIEKILKLFDIKSEEIKEI